MKLIVISSSKNSLADPKTITELFENGLNCFHLRKPSMSTDDMRKLIDAIPDHFHDRIVIHSHHKLAGVYNLGGIHLTGVHRRRRFSTWFRIKYLLMKNDAITISTTFHKLGHVYNNKSEYHYVLLGQIFDRLAGNFNAGYNEHSVRAVIAKSTVPIVARGGINSDSVAQCAELGFYGAALGSTIWDAQSPAEKWREILSVCQTNSIPIV